VPIMNAMASGGWCPVHDRVVPGRRKTCPDCGTPLVAMPQKAKAEPGPIRPEAELVDESAPAETTVENDPQLLRFGTPALAAIVTGIIAVSFLAGVAIPRHSSSKPPASNAPLTKSDVAVNLTRVGAGVRLRLESFSQRGATVILRVAVPDDPRIDTGLIQGVTVAFSERNVELARVPMPTRATPDGFIAAVGVPDLAHAHIDSVRLTAMTVGLPGPPGGVSGRIDADLHGVWPGSTRAAPKARYYGKTVGLPDGRKVRLNAIVGWPDHLEARLDMIGQRFNWDYNESYTLAPLPNGPVTGRVQSQDGTASTRYVSFTGLDPKADSIVLIINVTDFTINGDWTWPVK